MAIAERARPEDDRTEQVALVHRPMGTQFSANPQLNRGAHMSPTTATLPITIDVLLGPDEWNAGLHSDALAGLAATPKTLTPTWLYDDTGRDGLKSWPRIKELIAA